MGRTNEYPPAVFAGAQTTEGARIFSNSSSTTPTVQVRQAGSATGLTSRASSKSIVGTATGAAGIGLLGQNFNTNGATGSLQIGVKGVTSGSQGTGVVGLSLASGQGVGVSGTANGTGGIGVGGGVKSGVTGIGVLGLVNAAGASASLFTNFNSSGDLIRGIGGTSGAFVFRVNAQGRVFADGGFQTSGADFAEEVSVRGPKANYEPGDVLAIDQAGQRRLTPNR